MANFAAVVDPDPERRGRFVERAGSAAPICDGLIGGRVDSGDLTILWACAASAPVDVHRQTGGAAVIWGDALPEEGAPPLGAEALFKSWARNRPEKAPAASGFHAALVWTRDRRLVLGGDVLGLFPLYYWTAASGVVVVASSPMLIRTHPDFVATRSLEGLAGILLTGGIVEGRTLWQDLFRLAPGHLLVWGGADGRCRQVEQYARPSPTGSSSFPLDQAIESFDARLSSTVARHASVGGAHVLLLSGGRDSRLLAGALERRGVPFRAVTMGRRGDFEARCARRVTHALGVEHRLVEVELDRFADLADRHVRAEAILGNFAGLHNWGLLDLLVGDPARLLGGYVLELVCGGVELEWAGESDSTQASTDAFWGSVERHAFSLQELDSLIRHPELREAVLETHRGVRSRFEGLGDRLQDRARAYLFDHWARFHPGAIVWRLSFAGWPVAPVLDTALLVAGARLSGAARRPREVQDMLLRRFHPRLARLPIVRPSGSLEPLTPDLRWWMETRLRATYDRLARRLPRRRGGPTERRRYRRIYDLDNTGWIAVRRRAEPFREELHDLFRSDALMSFLPPPDQRLGLRRPIAESFGRKSLIGLMLLAGVD